MFATEKEMSIQFEKFLKCNFGNAYIKEKTGLFGTPDFVCYSKQNDFVSVISFELKLRNWKRAAQQAFRYKSFSNTAYVVLTAESIDLAMKNITLFQKYDIGLACFKSNKDFEIVFKPTFGVPYSESLNQKLIESIGACRKKSKNLSNFMA